MKPRVFTLLAACAMLTTSPAFASAKASPVSGSVAETAAAAGPSSRAKSKSKTKSKAPKQASKLVTVTPAQALDKALEAALKNNNKLAEGLLKQVLVVSKEAALVDRAHLELARVDYQEGQFDNAAEEYRKVSKDSPQWLTSLEERGWAELRAGKPAQSLAATKTVLNPQFSKEAGTEPFFLQALTQLKICDYPGVLQTVKDFKIRMKPVAAELQSRSDSGDAKARIEAKDMSQMIAKLQLVEVEATQHMYAVNKDGKRKEISKINSNKNTVEFPDSDEVWQDELEDSYQIQAKGCPTLGGLGGGSGK